MDLDSRVSILETEMATVKEDISEIKDQIAHTATKNDIDDLKLFFGTRDKEWIQLVTWIVKALVIVFGTIILASYGIEKIPNLFG